MNEVNNKISNQQILFVNISERLPDSQGLTGISFPLLQAEASIIFETYDFQVIILSKFTVKELFELTLISKCFEIAVKAEIIFRLHNGQTIENLIADRKNSLQKAKFYKSKVLTNHVAEKFIIFIGDQHTELRQLNLERFKLNNFQFNNIFENHKFTQLESLDLSYTQVSDLIFLKYFPALTALKLVECPKLTSQSFKGMQTGLKSLNFLECTGIKELDFFKLFTNLTNLSFSWAFKKDTSFSALPSLTHLRVRLKKDYDLGFVKNMPNITNLFLDVLGEVELNINALSHLTKLSKLVLSGLEGEHDFNSLEKCPLKTLKFEYCDDLEKIDLQFCTGLETLTIKQSDAEIDSLEKCTVLKNLNLAGSVTTQNMKSLAFYTTLKNLDLSGNSDLEDLNDLYRHRELEILDLRESSLKNIEFLYGFNFLKSLNLSGNYQIETFDVLESCTALEDLDLEGCNKLMHINFVKTMPRLKILNLSSGDGIEDSYIKDITDLSPLEHAKNLTHLDLSKCPEIEDINVLEHLKILRKLNLKYCFKIKDISALGKCPSLKELDLFKCSGIINFNALKNCIFIEILNLNFCKITDLSFLESYKSLKKLSLGGCDGIKSIAPLQFSKTLKELIISECYGIEDLYLLEFIPTLERLMISSQVADTHPMLINALLAKDVEMYVDGEFINQPK